MNRALLRKSELFAFPFGRKPFLLRGAVSGDTDTKRFGRFGAVNCVRSALFSNSEGRVPLRWCAPRGLAACLGAGEAAAALAPAGGQPALPARAHSAAGRAAAPWVFRSCPASHIHVRLLLREESSGI